MNDRASGEEVTQAYELLRAQAQIGALPGATPMGLAAFQRGGLPELMASWRRLLPLPAPTAQPESAAPALPALAASGIGRELALLLVQMALASSALNAQMGGPG